ncbi:MAG: arginine--tRNA ligase [Patescibacteria group bacterium]
MSIRETLTKQLASAVSALQFPTDKVNVTVVADPKHGDYASNIAMILAKQLKKNPLEVAQHIVTKLQELSSDFTVEVVKPGFINFFMKDEVLFAQVQHPSDNSEAQNKKIMIEFAHPNTHKAFHIGHLRNITTGEAIVRLIEAVGNKVIRVNYQGDVGMHIAKAMYALTSLVPYNEQVHGVTGIIDRVTFLGKAYAAGSAAYEEDEEAKKKIQDYNYLVYASAQRFQEEKGIAKSSTDYLSFVYGRTEEVDVVYELWKETRQWSLDYFEQIYKRVGTHYDRYYFESECLKGVDLAKEAVTKKVLEESNGAIVFKGEQYGLDTRVFVNSLGLPTYEAKELGLAEKELSEFGELDNIIHVVGPEQASFFQVTFKVEELLGMQKGQQEHLAYGWVKLKHGKMSSRTGNVVLGEWLLNEAKSKILETYPAIAEGVADAIAVGAIKYSFLRVGTTQEIAFDFDESINMQGNSGPYLQYTYARTQSVLHKSKMANGKWQMTNTSVDLEPEERELLRLLAQFTEIIETAATKYAPNVLCTYLFELAQSFNGFYQKCPIIKAESPSVRATRLFLTAKTGDTIKQGLHLLGIQAPEKM